MAETGAAVRCHNNGVGAQFTLCFDDRVRGVAGFEDQVVFRFPLKVLARHVVKP